MGLTKIQERVHWPGYLNKNASWVQEFKVCQQQNLFVDIGVLLILITSLCPFEKISQDFMVTLPVTSRENEHILAGTDHFTK